MALFLAYLGVVLIWSTTPLAVKLSTDSLDFSFAAAARMTLATLICVTLVLLLRVRLRFDAPALRSYASASLGMFGAMSLTYAAVGCIPSGLISVIFGLAPVLSGLVARWLLGERTLSPLRVLALILALSGLAIVFRGTLAWQAEAWPGLVLTLSAVTLFAFSNVLVKRHAEGLNPLQHTTGALLFSLPLFLLSWLLLDGQPPAQVSTLSAASVLYLAVIGSVVAFLLYFRVLRQLTATQVALIPLMTPPLAVLLGAWIAAEPVQLETLVGGACILAGLALYQFHQGLFSKRPAAAPAPPIVVATDSSRR